MRYRVVQKAEFRVVGKKARVPLVHEGMNPAIVAFVRGIGQETLRRLEELSDQEPHGIVGVTAELWIPVELANSGPPVGAAERGPRSSGPNQEVTGR